jgi:membrane-associated protease RseP (regulator of RpoE activity)
MTQLTGFLWFVFMLAPLILLQRLLHREIQAVFLILTRDPGLTMGLFSIIFLPGVFLHELSHFLMAKILFIPTGKFSIFP